MTNTVKRACDACHRRKVKCDGLNPCRNCNSASLNCTYNAVPQKKGPKGSRAKVISALREDQKLQSLSAQVQNRINGIAGPPMAPSLAPTSGLLTVDMVRECLDFFFVNMYPHMPILSRAVLEQQAMYMDQNLDTYCLVTSLCALTMLQPGMGIPGGDPYGLENTPGANILSSTVLVEETIRVRKGYDYIQSPSLNTLCTSYFLFACYYGTEQHDKAWFHLREATTMIHMAGLTTEEAYAQLDPVDSSRRRRLYWILFVAERAYALRRNRPLSLQATINLPSLADDPTDPYAHVLDGFNLVINLFRPFDDAFLALWNKSRLNWPAAHLHTLQKQLAEIQPSFLNYGDSRLGDLGTTQQWLKNMTWQLNMEANGDESAVFQPCAANLVASLLPSSPQGSEMSATPFLTKFFEVACNLTEVLALHPASRNPLSPGPHEQLNPLLDVLTMLRNRKHNFMPLLLTKVQEVLPQLASPMLQDVPDSVANSVCNFGEIFDGFGNAGMAQPPMMDNFEKKYPSPESSGSQAGGSASGNDFNSPFVSSPVSPPSDFAQGVPNNSFNHMSEMMMNQMRQSIATPGSTSNQPPTPRSQHQPGPSIMPMPTLNPHIQNSMNVPPLEHAPNMATNHQNHHYEQNFNQALPYNFNAPGQNMTANNMMQRHGPSRANSFPIAPNPQVRAMGNLQNLEAMGTNMNTIGVLGGMDNMGHVETDVNFSQFR